MKLYKYSLALLMGIGTLTSCSDKLELQNPNEPTSTTFGTTVEDLNKAVIACYHHCRMEGTFARVGFTHDLTRGDEVWNSSQQWYLGGDNYNAASTDEVYGLWIWRDWYYVINISNLVVSRCNEMGGGASEGVKRAKGQALFTRGLAYYNLCVYYQNPAIVTDFNQYNNLDGLYFQNYQEGDEDGTAQYDRAMDQAEADLKEAMTLLPSKSEGGEWALGRANSGAAAGIYARVLMQRHKYKEALDVLKKIIKGDFGKYELVKNYGDNFREGSAYENNKESIFEVQFLDYGSQGTDEEWTPVNVSKNSTQGHAVESNFGVQKYDGWADLSAAPWLYNLFLGEKTTAGKLDPRLYWTIGTYEKDWEGDSELLGNVCYTHELTEAAPAMTNDNNGGLPIAKYTNLRTGIYNMIVKGLRCGINLRIMRYSDVLLRAAECENELNGPTQQAIDWINEVRNRAKLAGLKLEDFAGNADKLFEQIANVERPKEFGCEYGRGMDLQRWGFYYDGNRLQQMKEHTTYRLSKDPTKLKQAVNYSEVASDDNVKSSFDNYTPGHEYLPIFQNSLNENGKLRGNSANYNRDNSGYFSKKGWTVHPVVNLK